MNHREHLKEMVQNHELKNSVDAATIMWAYSRINALEKALQKTVDALDILMGDTDLDEDSSPEFQAMQEASKLLNEDSK